MKRLSPFMLLLLAIEFLDELIYGAREAAWPLIRQDLSLTYTQIGLLLSIPGLVSAFIEPVLGILGDTWKRRVLVLGGGIFFTGATLLIGLSDHFNVLLLAFIFLSPSSGAFVNLAQSTLMDEQPDRHEQNMARWTFAGSVGVVSGPLVLGGAALLGWDWQQVFISFAFLSGFILLFAFRYPFPTPAERDELAGESPAFLSGLKQALESLKRKEVLRWLVLLEFSDLMLDILLGFLALYFVDVAGLSIAQAGIGVAVWTGVGLLGDFLLIPMLERVHSLTYLRISVMLEMVLFPAFLLVPGYTPKLVLLGLLGLFNAGWYSILKGQLYSSMPGQSGTVMTVNNISGLLGNFFPLLLGIAAERFGLGVAIWFLLLGPVVLFAGLQRPR